EAREARPSASRAGPTPGSLRCGADATAGTLATLHAAAAGSTAPGLGSSATTGLLLAAAVVLGRHDDLPRGVQQAPSPAVIARRRSAPRGITPPGRDRTSPQWRRRAPRRAGGRRRGARGRGRTWAARARRARGQ